MNITNYITSNCTITQNVIYDNKVPVFEQRGSLLPDFMLSAYQQMELNYPKFYKMDNLSKLGWLAAEVLLKNSSIQNYKPEQVGLVLSNANASLDSDKRYMASVSDFASPALFVYTLPNIMVGEICIRNNFKGEDAFFIFEKFNPGFLAEYVDGLLNSDTLKACICGWVDVIDANYKAVLFLIEKEKRGTPLPFNAENLNSIFDNLIIDRV